MQPEISLTPDEQLIVSNIRSLIGDQKEAFLDDFPQVYRCENFSADWTLYRMREYKGYPLSVSVSGAPYTVSGYPQVISYKFLQFPTPSPIHEGVQFSVFYEHFDFSDREILEAYDNGATIFLQRTLGEPITDYPIELLTLGAGYVLLQQELMTYIESAVSIQDSDSQYEAETRAEILRKYLDQLKKQIDDNLAELTSAAMLGLDPHRVE